MCTSLIKCWLFNKPVFVVSLFFRLITNTCLTSILNLFTSLTVLFSMSHAGVCFLAPCTGMFRAFWLTPVVLNWSLAKTNWEEKLKHVVHSGKPFRVILSWCRQSVLTMQPLLLQPHQQNTLLKSVSPYTTTSSRQVSGKRLWEHFRETKSNYLGCFSRNTQFVVLWSKVLIVRTVRLLSWNSRAEDSII